MWQTGETHHMRMTDTVLKPMHPEGWRFVGIFAVITALLFWLWEPLGWIGVVLTIWCYYFFRDPVRQVPEGEGLVISPADGMISQIATVLPPPELGMAAEPMTRISVFMSVFNVHVNRSPVSGVLKRMAYTKGKFVNASLDKASEHNERNALLIELPDGREIACVQIAGLVARRILPFVKEGDMLYAGRRFGLIRFGSRVDVYLPPGVSPLVAEGQTMIAGETVMADLTGSLPPRPARAE
ncbi:phosphatidylserine decarboxylase [Haematobacter missouriensis]|nr:phosphatidylserine decarboxylase [Haematobacter missouriensis]